MDLREKSFADTVRDIAAEGVVLLENNGVLPLTEDRKRIALYGAGAVLTRKGGTGSGRRQCGACDQYCGSLGRSRI